MHRRKQQGFNLLELSLVLVLVAALIMGSLQLYQVVENKRRLTSASEVMLDVYQAATQYQELPNKPDLIKQFVSDGFLPKRFESSAINPWGGGLSAKNAQGQLAVVLTQLPVAACRHLMLKLRQFNAVDQTECLSSERDARDLAVTFRLELA